MCWSLVRRPTRRRARKDRRVVLTNLRDGTAALTAIGPPEAIAAAWARLDASARDLREQARCAPRVPGQERDRTLDQYRFDLLVTQLTSGVAPSAAGDTGSTDTTAAGTSCGTGAPPGSSCTPQPDDPDGDDCLAPSWLTTWLPAVPAHITNTMPLDTALGLAGGDPALLDHYGPIAADLARDLAEHGIWRCLAVDGTHGTVLGVGRNTHTPGYRPGVNLRTFTEHTAPVCSIHLCGTRADRCDLDHAIPYASGGATRVCTVRPLCRTHHRLKTAGLIELAPAGPDVYAATHDAPPGTLLLTTRAGLTCTAPPRAPLPVAEATGPDRSRREQSRPPQHDRPTGRAADDPPPF